MGPHCVWVSCFMSSATSANLENVGLTPDYEIKRHIGHPYTQTCSFPGDVPAVFCLFEGGRSV